MNLLVRCTAHENPLLVPLLATVPVNINSWKENANSFTWTATADEVLAKVRIANQGDSSITMRTHLHQALVTPGT